MDKLNKYSRIWGVVFFSAAAIFAVLRLVPEYRIPNILQMQFADNLNELYALMKPYSADVLRNNTYLDFVYVLCYTILFLLSVKVFELSLGFKRSKWFYIFALLPGILDIIENVSFLKLIDGASGNAAAFQWFFWCGRIKWLFVNVFLLITFTIVLYYGLVLLGRLYNFIVRK